MPAKKLINTLYQIKLNEYIVSDKKTTHFLIWDLVDAVVEVAVVVGLDVVGLDIQ